MKLTEYFQVCVTLSIRLVVDMYVIFTELTLNKFCGYRSTLVEAELQCDLTNCE